MGRCHIHVAVADVEHFPALGRHAQFLHQGAGALGCGFGGHINAEVIDKDEALKMIRLKIIIKNQDNKKVSRAKMRVLVMK